MGRREEVETLIRRGLTPSEAAGELGISAASAIQYLRTRVGEGQVRLSEIYYSLPQEKRKAIEIALKTQGSPKPSDVQLHASFRPTSEDVYFYKALRTRSTFAGDLYEYLSEVEIVIHDLVSKVLKEAFGDEESGYWRKGVPRPIRIRCQEHREEDEEPSGSPLQYTTLIELSQIIDKNWSLFEPLLPKDYQGKKRLVASHLARLNAIRNAVMHPVKRRRWSEADFQFAAKLHADFKRYRAT